MRKHQWGQGRGSLARALARPWCSFESAGARIREMHWAVACKRCLSAWARWGGARRCLLGTPKCRGERGWAGKAKEA